jgi:glycosyltransferase involved in cell wall biosynthesis
LVLEETHVHPRYHERILDEEARLLGLKPSETGRSWERSVDRQLEELDLADYVVALSPFAQQTLVAEGVSAQKIVVISPGVAAEHYYPTRRRGSTDEKQDRPFRILFVGTISARKGVYYLLEAFRQLALPNAELWLLGSIDEGMARILAKYEGMFRLLPPVPRERLHEYYNAADLFVLPSLLESFGLVIYQAMACGLPVIVTTSCGARVQEGREGFVIAPRDIEALKERVVRLYNDRNLLLAMSSCAVAADQQQSWERFRWQVVEFLLRIYEHHRGASAGVTA